MGIIKADFKEKPHLTVDHRMENGGGVFISSAPSCVAFSLVKIHPIGGKSSILLGPWLLKMWKGKDTQCLGHGDHACIK